jgi:uncharacterized membrane protein
MKIREDPSPSSPAAEERLHRVELLISNLLRIGVILSLTLVVIGTIISFVHHPEYVSSSIELQQLTQAGASFPYTLRDVLTGVLDLRGKAFVTVGLLLLIATPVARVAVSILAFLYQKDRVYTLITLIVLCLLLLSFVLGKVE